MDSIGKVPQYAAFVVDRSGQLFLGEHAAKKFHHSSFLSGEQVSSAGTIKVIKGKVERVDNMSGHYHPTENQMVNVIESIPVECFKSSNSLVAKDRAFLVINFTSIQTQKRLASMVNDAEPGDFQQAIYLIAPKDGVIQLLPVNMKLLPQNFDFDFDSSEEVSLIEGFDLIEEVHKNREQYFQTEQTKWQHFEKTLASSSQKAQTEDPAAPEASNTLKI